jgi:RNase adapter protein RapZ
MLVRLISSGKSAVLGGQINADLYIDCRVMVNPFRDPKLGGKTGDDPEVQSWIVKENHEFVRAVVKLIELGLTTAPSRNSFKQEAKPFTVCFFCLAGVHRSRGTKNVLGNILKQRGHQVEVVK